MAPCPPVSTPSPRADVYIAAFVARCDGMRARDQRAIDEPGVLGLPPSAKQPVARLLVTDDRAYDVLAALLPDARAGMINVFAEAARCAELVEGLAAWRPQATTALIRRELQTVPEAPLPCDLRLRRVRRRSDDPPDGVPLEDAAAAELLADPKIDGRGIGWAMTAAALRAAREHGARQACLNATDAGLSIYQRLGFDLVSRTTRFFHATDSRPRP